MQKKLVNLILLLISITILLLGGEVVLRFLGYKPWSYSWYERRNEAVRHEHHPILGWINKEGNYIVSPYDPNDQEFHMTFLKGGLRKTYENQKDARDQRAKLIFVGGSFTQGWAISDNETFPYKVQERLRSFEVLNYGTEAYGTYQSLLTLEQILPSMPNPNIVVYGFNDFHDHRNVAGSYWLEKLSQHSKKNAHVYVPYATISKNGELTHHQPDRYPSFPLREKSALITLAEKAFMQLKTSKRENQKKQVTQKLMLEMQRLCNEYGIDFIVAVLSTNKKMMMTKSDYMRFLDNNGIMAVDCDYPMDGMRVSGDGHPNGDMNTIWANCIADFIEEKITTNN